MLYLTIAIFIFLTACGSNLSYKTEFPEDPSGEMLSLVSHLVSNHNYLLFELEDTYFFSERNLAPNESIKYYMYTEEKINNLYNDFFKETEHTPDFLNKLKEEANENLFLEVEQPKEFSLPIVELLDDNILHVETNIAEKNYDLSELLSEYDLQSTDEIYFNVVAVNEDAFQIDIKKNEPTAPEVALFVKQDLSNIVVTQPFGNEIELNLQEKNLSDFEGLFVGLGSDGDLLKTTLGNEIWNEEEKTLTKVDANDYLSENGQFVYLQGKDLDRQGNNHYIQRIEDYLNGTNDYYARFKLDYEELGDELGIDSVGAKNVNLKYLNDRYAVLYVTFAGAITGTTGSTNVIVDLKEDTVFLVDWKWM